MNISPEVHNLIQKIIVQNDLSNDSDVTYDVGSENGDGYLSRGVAVTIKDGERTLEIFVKCCLEIESSAMLPVDRYYANEIDFYSSIYPAFTDFIREKDVTDGFTNVAKCYGNSGLTLLALENLKKNGYRLCDKTKSLDDKHTTLVLEAFAKFHATCFAFKDQKKEEYERLTRSVRVPYEDFEDEAMNETYRKNLREILAGLDPVKDKHLLDRTAGLPEFLIDYGKKNFLNPEPTGYDILTKGDCWCNNVMFLYENENSNEPTTAILIDWQIIRICTPVFDLAYFFYTVASEEAMADWERYVELYHCELSRQLKKLGGDPEVLFPLSVLKAHWKEHAKFGLYMGSMLIRLMLSAKDEQINLEEVNVSDLSETDFFGKIKNNDEYFRRMKAILVHMVANDFV